MTTHVGVDLLHIAELDLLARRAWFLRFLFSAEELDALATADSARLTGWFAAKEAVLKVLRSGLSGPVPPAQIVLRCHGTDGVSVELRGAASTRARLLGISQVHVCIARNQAFVIAVALGTGQQGL
ncbi:4'-phosphopantetheinyl transferase superfamily protein [Amycolatopsis sp. SID8362]|uniref:4'-phosphopantetheinyl transferase superfamily protein n=1 Tax=Amycolatopsis sp. SID8362 TaxID=2690346 RepID=UPI00136B8D8D|nr:4'-phosphopantetheinyl transferase superfamily protein [Amycolatopsis sp. SID8362]NBH03203.1 4'-phosphopantetheinyl transferase superfamily protein [Amycolatopsis sp. SID8362]NED39904.1 4'-phosphopantetheinyl transferase superfamily protein [Amycolatopsis sp. SID8362]